MVYFKITDGVETRKFQVTPGKLTFQQLQERIGTLFPETTTSNLVLRYRDTEGDVITLSSNEEFQEALSDLPKDHVWKLHITSTRVKRQQREARPFSLPNHIFEPSWSPCTFRRKPASELEKEAQELIHLLFGAHDSTSTSPEGKDVPTAKDEEEARNGEGASPESAKAQDNSEGTASSEASPKKEEVKSNPSGSESSSESLPKCGAGHCYGVKRVGLWEPFLFGGPFGPTRVSSAPVGYHITWGPRTCNASTGSAACA